MAELREQLAAANSSAVATAAVAVTAATAAAATEASQAQAQPPRDTSADVTLEGIDEEHMFLPAELMALARGEGVAHGQGLTLVPISAQLELTLPLSAQLEFTWSPICPKSTRGCGPKVLKLSPNVSDVSRRSLS